LEPIFTVLMLAPRITGFIRPLREELRSAGQLFRPGRQTCEPTHRGVVSGFNYGFVKRALIDQQEHKLAMRNPGTFVVSQSQK
jgi:hypothetical protein